MVKVFTRLGAVLVAACCAGAGPALAQPHHGAAAAPAPHITAPAVPHVSAPVAPHVSAPAPHVAATPHFNAAPPIKAAPHIHAAPHVATPRFSTQAPSVHQVTPRGHGFTGRSFAHQPVRGPAATRHELGRFAGRPVTHGASRSFAGRNIAGRSVAGGNITGRNVTRHATRSTGSLARSTQPAPAL